MSSNLTVSAIFIYLTTAFLNSNVLLVLKSKYQRTALEHSLRMKEGQKNSERILLKIHNITSWIVYWLECLREAYKEALSRISPLSQEISSEELIYSDRLTKAFYYLDGI